MDRKVENLAKYLENARKLWLLTPWKWLNIDESSKLFCSRAGMRWIDPYENALQSSDLGASNNVPTVIIRLTLADLSGPEG